MYSLSRREFLQGSALLAAAAVQVAEKRGDGYKLDTNKIIIRRMPGGSLADTRLVRGVVLEKDLIDRNMPKRLENVKIIVGDVSLVIKKTIAEAKITMTDPRMVAKLGARLPLSKSPTFDAVQRRPTSRA